MKLKLDENLPRVVAQEFIGHLHDVDTVTDELAGAGDPAVLGAARDEERMLITLDRGFGDVRSYPPGTHPGIIVLRPINQDPASITRLVERFLEVRKLEDLLGCIVVVEPVTMAWSAASAACIGKTPHCLVRQPWFRARRSQAACSP